MLSKRNFIGLGTAAIAAMISISAPAMAADGTLRIGVLGVMSGPAASWGLVNRYCAEARANMINAEGGFEIDGKKYKIEIVSIDDRNDPKVAVSGAERLVYQEGIRYIIGPNIDTTAAAIVPVIEKAGAMNFPYAFSRQLYVQPRSNSVLGMIASYQAGPVIYQHLRDNYGVKTVAFVARNESDSLNQRNEGISAAKTLGLRVVAENDTYEPGTTDYFPIMTRLVRLNPDLIVLSGAAPSDAPLLIKSARQLGYTGLMSTETAQDAKILQQVAGKAANGFISVGGAYTQALGSDFMREFAKAYEDVAGEWNDEAGTKVYALEMILNAIKAAGADAIDDIDAFKAVIPSFSMENPFLVGNPMIGFVGKPFFGQKRQLPIPMVVNAFEDGSFKTMFVGYVK